MNKFPVSSQKTFGVNKKFFIARLNYTLQTKRILENNKTSSRNSSLQIIFNRKNFLLCLTFLQNNFNKQLYVQKLGEKIPINSNFCHQFTIFFIINILYF